MERITYRFTLDVHKNGIQRTLQGFETDDKKSRKLAINLVASGDTYEIPFDHVVALMYVTTANAKEPSINECTIEDNTIVYEVLDVLEEGITEVQLKLLEVRPNGARSVLVSPKFALEVAKSGTDDEGAEQTVTFTSLEQALARAKGVYDCRLLSIEVDEDCTFRVFYADGSIYENHFFRDALYNGNALLSESFAHGGTGIREGEDSDNSRFYKDIAREVLVQTLDVNNECRSMLNEVIEKSLYTSFAVDFKEGQLTYYSQTYNFTIDTETGELKFEGIGEWIPPDNKDTLEQLLAEVSQLRSRIETLESTS